MENVFSLTITLIFIGALLLLGGYINEKFIPLLCGFILVSLASAGLLYFMFKTFKDTEEYTKEKIELEDSFDYDGTYEKFFFKDDSLRKVTYIQEGVSYIKEVNELIDGQKKTVKVINKSSSADGEEYVLVVTDGQKGK